MAEPRRWIGTGVDDAVRRIQKVTSYDAATGEPLSPARPLRLRRRCLGHLAESADSLAFGAHILRMADMLAGNFGWNWGPIGPFWRPNRAWRWCQAGLRAEMLRWARPNRALFSTFFHFLVGIGPELGLFNPLFTPYACRCDDASAGDFCRRL